MLSVLHSSSWLNNSPLHGWTAISLSTSVDGRLGCFHVLAVVNNASMDIHVKFLFVCLFVCFCGQAFSIFLSEIAGAQLLFAEMIDKFMIVCFSFSLFFFWSWLLGMYMGEAS